jgi:hypothetical protein
MEYFRNVPSEIYKEVLFLVEPKYIFRACSTNQYALNICDETFYREYVDRNFDPNFYGLENFVLPTDLNWEQFLNSLIYGITLPIEVMEYRRPYNIAKRKVTIDLKDTMQDIRNKIISALYNKDKFAPIRMTLIIANIGTEKIGLLLYSENAYLATLDTPTDTIVQHVTSKNEVAVALDTPIIQISRGENFYFNMEKIWVWV